MLLDPNQVLTAREMSIERAILEVHGRCITDFVLPAESEEEYEAYAGRLACLAHDFSLCAQDAATLIWYEVLDIIASTPGAHFCAVGEACAFGNHDE
jgi:hypothetical protein